MNQKIKVLHEILGVSYNDSKALLASLQETQTADEIPLEALRELTRTDSSTNQLNKEYDISRNGPE